MKILGIEKVSFVDFPSGICATIFTGGCNFRCPFCHNSSIVLDKQNEIKEDEIFSYLLDRKKLLDGVTISGGEPTLQPDLEIFIVKLKNLGFKIKLDTNGSNQNVLKNLLDKKLVDYVAMDIKNNFDDYDKITATSSVAEKVKNSLALLRESGINYELRTTLVSEFHKTENIEKMARDLAGEKLLYLQKFKDTGTCFDSGLSALSKHDAEKFRDILEKTIKKVVLRGY